MKQLARLEKKSSELEVHALAFLSKRLVLCSSFFACLQQKATILCHELSSKQQATHNVTTAAGGQETSQEATSSHRHVNAWFGHEKQSDQSTATND